jgi:hypothetical protein
MLFILLIEMIFSRQYRMDSQKYREEFTRKITADLTCSTLTFKPVYENKSSFIVRNNYFIKKL